MATVDTPIASLSGSSLGLTFGPSRRCWSPPVLWPLL